MNKYIPFFSFVLFAASSFAAGGHVTYQVNGQSDEGYYVSPAADALLVLLVHDRDGITDYKVNRGSFNEFIETYR